MNVFPRTILGLLCCLWWGVGVLPAGENPSLGDLPQPGLLVMAHGGDRHWNEAVEQAVAALGSSYPVALAFGMAQPEPLQQAVDQLESMGVTHIAVVRLFVSPESFREQIEYLLRLRQDPPSHFIRHNMSAGSHPDVGMPTDHDQVQIVPGSQAPQPIHIHASIRLNREGLYDSEKIGEIVVDRVRSLSSSPQEESVLILAHGEGDESLNRRWQNRLEKLSRLLEHQSYRDVQVETLREDWYPERDQAEQRIRAYVESGKAQGGRVLVVPFRVFGFGPYAKVLEGLNFVSDGKGLLPHRAVTEWIHEQAQECFGRMGVFFGSDQVMKSSPSLPDTVSH